MPVAREVADYLDRLLAVPGFPDYPQALNGLQLDHLGPVRRIATAVDYSERTIEACIAAGANLLVLHHGMFWSAPQRLTGAAYRRLQRLVGHDIAVYAAHLPLDAHPRVGNCALLARALQLSPSSRFLEFEGVPIGVAGVCDTSTDHIAGMVQDFAGSMGGSARVSGSPPFARTRKWAIVTGAGADSATLRLAERQGIDTLIVGEGPHHTTVDAPEYGVTVIYAGHYATETLGVQALAADLEHHLQVPSEFLFLPTGS
jgi:dinuclear metal center YbgI/SA1388 family protein